MERWKRLCKAGALGLLLFGFMAGLSVFVCAHIVGASFHARATSAAGASVASGRNYSMPLAGGTGAKGVSVRFVNAGLGTTATHGVHKWFCKHKWPACHWETCCHVKKSQQRLHWELILLYRHARTDCVESKAMTEDCRTAAVLPAIRKQLSQILSSGIRVLADVPYERLLPQIMQEAPDTTVLFSQRDPEEWALKRMADHPPTIMCSRRAGWNGSCFDIMNCCQPSHHTFLFECWTLTYPEKVKQEDGADRRKALRGMASCMIEHSCLVEGLVPEHQLTRVNAFEGGDLSAQLDRAIHPRR